MTRATGAGPLVSVVVATYNASHLLRYAIASVQGSTVQDWEMIVVGDGCTDDTEQVVAGFGDPRMRFVNLPVNSGSQSAPNNLGVELAQGRYIAFLNQDDLYFPDHLALSIEELERTGSDIVWVPCASILPPTPEDTDAGTWQAELSGVPAAPRGDDGFVPFAFYNASSWVLRREVCARVGPWRPHDELYVTPSQDWLFRAARAGVDIRFLPRVTVLLIPSTVRRGSYTKSDSPEHARFASLLDDPEFRRALIESAALNTARTANHLLFRSPGASIRRALVWPLWAVLDRLGMHPFSAGVLLGGKGAMIRRAHRFAALPPQATDQATVTRPTIEG